MAAPQEAQFSYEAQRRAVRAADALLEQCGNDILGVFNVTGIGVGTPTPAGAKLFLEAIDPIIHRHYGRYGVSPWDSELYKLIRRESERAVVSQYATGINQLERVMAPSDKWPLIRQYIMSAPLDERDDLVTAFHMLYGPQVDRQRLINARFLDPQRRWVDPNGYRLSDRLWRNGRKYRRGIEHTLYDGIAKGKSHEAIARELRQYMLPEYAPVEMTADGRIVRKKTPRGKPAHGSTYARQLARTEINRVNGEATKQRARGVPGAIGIKWRLSLQHPKADHCDENATADEYELGPGIYLIDSVPTFPDHPNCMCSLVTQHEPRAVTRQKIVDKYLNRAYELAEQDVMAARAAAAV